MMMKIMYVVGTLAVVYGLAAAAFGDPPVPMLGIALIGWLARRGNRPIR